METFSSSLTLCAGNSPVSGEFPAQRPVTGTFGVFFDLRLIKRPSKHSRWWFKTLSHPLWRHYNVDTPSWQYIFVHVWDNQSAKIGHESTIHPRPFCSTIIYIIAARATTTGWWRKGFTDYQTIEWFTATEFVTDYTNSPVNNDTFLSRACLWVCHYQIMACYSRLRYKGLRLKP